jgi:putative MATE family efflux protein
LKLPFRPGVRRSSFEIDMTNGPLVSKIIRFAIPLALSGILQLLFNAADIVVAGRFAGSQALAAVGSTSALINLIVNLFIGLSIGVNVLVARYYGGGNRKDLYETVHTAVLVSMISGVVLIFIGIGLSQPLLDLMGTPDDVINQAVLYMRIYFVGMPVMMLYNFGAAILRAVGDTQRPLYFLLLAGVVNVFLNLFFVIVLHMGVAGVATATVISQCISAGLVLFCLVKSDTVYRVSLKELKIYKEKLIQMVKIGVPAGIQGATFSVSNVLLQSSINSFGSIAMAGSTAGSNIEGFVWTAMDAFTQSTLSFTGQNYGAKKFHRITKVVWYNLALVTLVGLVLGIGAYLAGPWLLQIYSTDPEVISYGLERMLLVCAPYAICGIMNVMVGAMRGLGSSLTPMMASIFGVCVLRVVWIYTIFPLDRTFFMLFLSYPVTWLATGLIEVVCFYFIRKRAIARAGGMAADAD